MPNSNKARATSHAFTLGCTLMTGAAMLAILPMSAQAQANPDAGSGNFYFFGDSATGQGNWSAIVGEVDEDHSPYSSNNGYMRESNGLIWAEMLGRDVDIILDPAASSSNLNFAISGAHMTRGGDLLEAGVETGVMVQTELFSGLVDNDAINVGANDVAFMLAGANDYLDRLEMDVPAQTIMAEIASAAAVNVRTLADAGVKTIILSEIQPLQYAPQYADSIEVQSALADLVDETNAAILEAVSAEALPSDVNIVTMKYGALVRYITENADALGFSNVTDSCIDPETDELCSADKEGQDAYLFFDDLHFTERAQRLSAQWWMATLDGANGTASRQAGRLPRIAYEQLESHRDYVRPGAHTDTDDTFAAWISPVRSSLKLTDLNRDPSANLSLDGAVLGMEGRIADRFFVGGALSVGETVAKFDDGARHRMEGGSFSLYGGIAFEDESRLSLSVTRGANDVTDISRLTGVDLLNAQGETDLEYWDVEIASRSTDQIGTLTIDHGVALAAGRIELDGYRETGATGLALEFEDQAFNYSRLTIDTVVKGRPIGPSRARIVRPVFDAAYVYQFGDDDYAVTSHLIDNSAQPVTVRSNAPTEGRFEVGLGAEIALGDNWTLSGRYGWNWADDIEDADEGTITLRATF